MCVVRWFGSPQAVGGCTRKGAVGHGQFVPVGRGSLSRSGGGQDLDDAIDLDGLALHHEQILDKPHLLPTAPSKRFIYFELPLP